MPPQQKRGYPYSGICENAGLKRFELRSPDATANPYYAYAAILMAGLDGMEKQIDPQANGWGLMTIIFMSCPRAAGTYPVTSQVT